MILRRLKRRLRALLFKKTLENELDAELRDHLERQVEENIAAGMTPGEARLDALRAFGGFEQAKEYCRDARGVTWFEDLRQDLHFGIRMLSKSPGFTFTAIFTLALGICANTIIFSSADATFLRPLSFPNQDRLVMIFERNPEIGIARGSVSPADVIELRGQAQTLQEVVAIRNRGYVLTAEGVTERSASYEVSAAFFESLGVQPQIGRTFKHGEDQDGHAQVVVLRHGFWQTRFGGDPQVVGKQITLDERPFEIIGVMPRHFEFPFGAGDMWTPFVMGPGMKQDLHSHQLRAIGLLKEGYTIEQASTELRNISERLQQQFPEQEAGRTAYAMALNDEYTRVAKDYVPMMIGSALLVLLIACSNVANLLLARAATRRKEMAMRLALGATRSRLIRQLITESVLLALLGGLLGYALAGWGLEAMSRGIPSAMSKFIPGWSRLGLNTTALVFTASISVLSGILFGLAPAWQATNINQTLKDGGSTSRSGSFTRRLIRNGLVVSQIGFSLMLLIAAGLLVRSFIQVVHADLGVKPASVVTMNLELPREKYSGKDLQRNLYQELIGRVENLSGVNAAGAINILPMSGNRSSGKFQIEGRPSDKGREHYTQIRIATPGYFAAIGTELRKGRLFDARDDAQASRVALVNQAFADHYLLNDEVPGPWIKLGETQGERFEIIGVIANAMKDEMVNVNEPGVYLPFSQQPTPQMNLVVRAPNIGERIVPPVRRELSELDSRLALAEIKTMEQVISERRSPQAFIMWILVIFGFAALSMAAVGMFAVMAYAVTQRNHEIGVRMALGAQSSDVLKLILGRGLRLTAFGLVIGLSGAFALTRFMRSLLYDVSPSDPPTFLAVVVILTFFALMACYIPARRATKVDPLIALRCE